MLLLKLVISVVVVCLSCCCMLTLLRPVASSSINNNLSEDAEKYRISKAQDISTLKSKHSISELISHRFKASDLRIVGFAIGELKANSQYKASFCGGNACTPKHFFDSGFQPKILKDHFDIEDDMWLLSLDAERYRITKALNKDSLKNKHSISELIGIKFKSSDLRLIGFTIKELMADLKYKSSFCGGGMLTRGECNPKHFLDAGFTVSDLKAADFKVDEIRRTCELSNKDLKLAGYTCTEIYPTWSKSANMLAELRSSVGCSVHELKEAKFSVKEMKAAQYLLKELKGYYPPAELKQYFDLTDFRESGYKVHDLLDKLNTFSYADFKNGGFTLQDIYLSRKRLPTLPTLLELKTAGYKMLESSPKNSDFDKLTIDNLRDAGYTVSELILEGKFQLASLKELNYEVMELAKNNMFEYKQLKEAGFEVTLQALRDSGYKLTRLKQISDFKATTNKEFRDQLHFTIKDFKEAKYTAKDLLDNPFSLQELKDAYPLADFIKMNRTLDELKRAGYGILELKGDFSLSDLKKVYKDNELFAGNFGLAELNLHNKNAAQLKTEYGFSLEQLLSLKNGLEPKFTITLLLEAGFKMVDFQNCLRCNVTSKFFTDGGFSADKLRKDFGFKDTELVEFGFDKAQLGYEDLSITSIIKKGNNAFTIKQLHEKFLFSLQQIKKSGSFQIEDFLRVGYAGVHLKQAGFTIDELISCQCKVVHVMNVPYQATVDAIKELFKSFGAIVKVTMEESAPTTVERNGVRGATTSAFVEFVKSESALKAVDSLHNKLGLGSKTPLELNLHKDAIKELSFLKECDFLVSDLNRIKYHNKNRYEVRELFEAGYTLPQIFGSNIPCDKLVRLHNFSFALMQKASCTMKELYDNGCSLPSCLKEAGYHLIQIKEFRGTSPSNKGFSIDELRSCYEFWELFDAGYSLEDLNLHKLSPKELHDMPLNFTFAQMRRAGITLSRLSGYNFNVRDILSSGYKKEELRVAGYKYNELKAAGLSAKELLGYGYTHWELFNEGEQLDDLGLDAKKVDELLNDYKFLCNPKFIHNMNELGFSFKEIASGCTFGPRRLVERGNVALEKLRDGGFTLKEFRDDGFNLTSIKEAGFSDKECFDAGYNSHELNLFSRSVSYLIKEGFSLSNIIDINRYEKEKLLVTLRSHFKLEELVSTNEFSLSDLSAAGFSLKDLKDSGRFDVKLFKDFLLKDLKTVFSVKELLAMGHDHVHLLNAGFSINSLYDESNPASLKENGFTVKQLRKIPKDAEGKERFGVAYLYSARYTIKELNSSYTLSEIKSALDGIQTRCSDCISSVKEYMNNGFSYYDLVGVGFSKLLLYRSSIADCDDCDEQELWRRREIGLRDLDLGPPTSISTLKNDYSFTLSDLVGIKYFSLKDFKECGCFSSDELKGTFTNLNEFVKYYSIEELRAIGFSLDDLRKKMHFKPLDLYNNLYESNPSSAFRDLGLHRDTISSLKEMKFSVDILKREGKTVKELESVFDIIDLHSGHFTLSEIKQGTLKFKLADFMASKFNAVDLLDAGFSHLNLYEAGGFTLEQLNLERNVKFLRSLNFTLAHFMKEAFSLEMLFDGGYDLHELCRVSSLPDLQRSQRCNLVPSAADPMIEVNFCFPTLSDLKRHCFPKPFGAREFMNLNITLTSLKEAGFTKSELHDRGGASLKNLYDAGFSAYDLGLYEETPLNLKKLGFDLKFFNKLIMDCNNDVMRIPRATCDTFKISKLKDAGFGVAELLKYFNVAILLKEGGITPRILKDEGGFTLKDFKDQLQLDISTLKSLGFELNDFRIEGYDVSSLKMYFRYPKNYIASGFTLQQLLIEGGFTYLELYYNDFDLIELDILDLSPKQLTQPPYNFSIKILKNILLDGSLRFNFKHFFNDGFSIKELKEAGFLVSDFLAEKVTCKQMKEADFGVSELYLFAIHECKGVFTLLDFKNAGNYLLKRLLKEGLYSLVDLTSAGFTIMELKANGAKVEKFKEEQFNPDLLLNGGAFTLKELFEVFSFGDLNLTNKDVSFLVSNGFTLNDMLMQSSSRKYTCEELKVKFSYSDLVKAGFDTKTCPRVLLNDFLNEKNGKDLGFKDIRKNGYTTQEVRSSTKASEKCNPSLLGGFMGYTPCSNKQLVDLFGYAPADFKNDNLSAVEFLSLGFDTILNAQEAEYNLKTLVYDFKYPIVKLTKLHQKPYVLSDFKRDGVVLSDLKASNVWDCKQFKEVGYTSADMKMGGFKASEIKDIYSVSDMLGSWTLAELRDAGFSCKSFVDMINKRSAAVGAYAFKSAGFAAKELLYDRCNGAFSEKELVDNGYSFSDLGYHSILDNSTLTTLRMKGFSPGDVFIQLAFEMNYYKELAEDSGKVVEVLTKIRLAGFKYSDIKDSIVLNDHKMPIYICFRAGYTLTDLGLSESVRKNENVLENFKVLKFNLKDILSLTVSDGLNFSCAQFKKAGFSAKALKDEGWTMSQLKEDDCHHLDDLFPLYSKNIAELLQFYTIKQLIDKKTTAKELIAAGCQVKDLKDYFTARKLYSEAGVSIIDLAKAWGNMSTLLNQGFTLKELPIQGFKRGNFELEGFSLYSLAKHNYFNLVELKHMGYSCGELYELRRKENKFPLGAFKEAGFTATELKFIDITAKELYMEGYNLYQIYEAEYSLSSFDIDEMRMDLEAVLKLKNGGFTKALYFKGLLNVKDLNLLVKAGFRLSDLIDASYSLIELKKYTDIDMSKLKEGGFTLRQFVEADYEIRELFGIFTVADMVKGGIKLNELHRAGIPMGKLVEGAKVAGATLTDFRDNNFELKLLVELRNTDGNYFYRLKNFEDAEFSITELHLAGASIDRFIGEGYQLGYLHEKGISIKDLDLTGADVQIFKGHGFALEHLKTFYKKDTSITLKQMKEVYSINDFRTARFPLSDLKEAGFTIKDIKSSRPLLSLKDFKDSGVFTLAEICSSNQFYSPDITSLYPSASERKIARC